VVVPWVRESYCSCSLSAVRFCNLAVDGSDHRRGRNLLPYISHRDVKFCKSTRHYKEHKLFILLLGN
jgi:hypothetical protein